MTAGSSANGRVRLSRPLRVARGAAGAAIATLLAAASHALAGGDTTLLAITATALLSLPLCVALAGRAGSLWRLTLGVSVSQFVYHWSFAGLGVATGSTALGEPAPAHAEHLGALASFAPAVSQAGAADSLMWAAHAVAAALTVALMHRGERAVLSLLGMIRRALPVSLPASSPIAARPRVVGADAPRSLRNRLCSVGSITHRGPPAPAVL